MKIDCVFFNAVARIKTSMKPALLKSLLKEIEKQMGRTPSSEEILIDLDIILVNGKIIHEDYMNRKFIRELIQTIENCRTDC
jgi:2-amino-4-hydroxy-6-hydroxymethyldihydropteridine diphosphokinase